MLIDLPSLSLSVEIEIEKGLDSINTIFGRNTTGTKGGFCKVRSKICPDLFKVINRYFEQ